VTVTLEIPQELEAKLTAQADSRGLSLRDFLQVLIADQIVGSESSPRSDNPEKDEEEADEFVRELFGEPELPSGVGASLKREDWYDDRHR
jgi:hypothetical protein